MWIDLRSDTVTQPTTEMRKAIAEAEVGDDVHHEDPSVLRTWKRKQLLSLGKEAGSLHAFWYDDQPSWTTHSHPTRG